jgi:hypothetical protein
MWFPKELKDTVDLQEMIAELSYIVPTGIASSSDDAIDVISMLNQMNIIIPEFDAPGLPAPVYNSDDDIWDTEIIEDSERSSYVF